MSHEEMKKTTKTHEAKQWVSIIILSHHHFHHHHHHHHNKHEYE